MIFYSGNLNLEKVKKANGWIFCTILKLEFFAVGHFSHFT